MEIIDQIFDTLLILLVAYSHIVLFVDTGKMAKEMATRGTDLELRVGFFTGSNSTPVKIDGWTPVDRTMFLT